MILTGQKVHDVGGHQLRADQRRMSTIRVAVYDDTAFRAAQFSSLVLSLGVLLIVVLLIIVGT
jgi:hypothetical protein